MKFLKRYHLKHYKFSLIMLVLAISAVGVVAVGSARKRFTDATVRRRDIRAFGNDCDFLY